MHEPMVDPPVPATAVLVDLRNFTPNLKAAGCDANGTNQFCFFLAEFYDATLNACLLALPPDARDAPNVTVNGTGDGVLVVFMGPRHFAHGLLAAFLLDASLRRCCEGAGSKRLHRIAFGVGVESGEVSFVRTGHQKLSLATVIGHCVNMAARIEAITKVVASARVAIGDANVEHCAEAFYGIPFAALREREQEVTDDAERLAIQKQMNDMNFNLCLAFLDRYVLKGVDDPLPLYRIDGTAARPGVARFDRVLRHLVADDAAHLAEVKKHLGFSV